MLYHYLASDKTGRIIEGDVEADDLQRVLQHLAGQELRPVSIKAVKESPKGIHRFFSTITLSDKIFLTRYLSLMLKVGADLLSAINILISDFDKPAMRNFLLEIRENLVKGQPFYQVFTRYPGVFSPVFISLVKAAELSGNLQQTFSDLSLSLQKEAQFRGRIRSALIYPVILVVVAMIIFIFLTVFALPRIAHVFLESGIQPPLFSKVVFTVGLFLGDHILSILTLVFSLLAGAIYFFGKNEVGRRVATQILSRLPLVRGIYRDLAVQRFASTFSVLLKAGLPIVQTIQVAAEVVGIEQFKYSLLRIANEGLTKGLTVGEAFKRETVFPRVVSNLVSISEKAGHLEEVLESVADFYAANVDANIQALVAVLEPILLLVLGLIVGGIALAIIVPIYQLTSQF